MTLDLLVERPAAGGRMIARHAGKVVLVAGAIPGERVRAAIERNARDVAFARTVEVLEPSADRRPVMADPACGGHAYAHIAYHRQLALKSDVVADALRRIAHFPLPAPVLVHPSPERGYRLRARLHARGARLGFLREASHRLCDPAATGQLSDEATAVVAELASRLRAAPAIRLAAVDLTENLRGDQRALHLQLAPEVRLDPTALAGPSACEGVTGVTAAGPDDADVIVIAGDALVRDPLRELAPGLVQTEVAIGRRAVSFFQGNRYLLPRLVTRVVSEILVGPVVDLYAGVGLFALAVAASGRGPVTAVEGEPHAARDLQHNAAPLDASVEAVHAPVEAFLAERAPQQPGAIIVDPPRTGLSSAALEGIHRSATSRVIYVSCDVATFARDLAGFVTRGYALERLEAFDLFPNTAHIELLAVLARQ